MEADLAEINESMKSSDPEIKKEAEITRALVPSVVFRAPNANERDLSTQTKWSARFNKFWTGD